MNEVKMIGRLTRDSENKDFATGANLLQFSIAISDDYKDKNGEWKKVTDYVNVKAWNKLGTKYSLLKKGDSVLVCGKFKTDAYETKDGVKKYTSYVNANSIMLEKPKGQDANVTTDVFNSDSPIKSDASFTADDIPF